MHLFVVGPPGIGKSTVAPLLAGMLGASVVETDRAIARRARKTTARRSARRIASECVSSV
ncbi:MAG: AAA family ATPase [Chloroflexi bacterium]|nr:MAG: AAA family ATPase [Chloroflexota bacterium]